MPPVPFAFLRLIFSLSEGIFARTACKNLSFGSHIGSIAGILNLCSIISSVFLISSLFSFSWFSVIAITFFRESFSRISMNLLIPGIPYFSKPSSEIYKLCFICLAEFRKEALPRFCTSVLFYPYRPLLNFGRII